MQLNFPFHPTKHHRIMQWLISAFCFAAAIGIAQHTHAQGPRVRLLQPFKNSAIAGKITVTPGKNVKVYTYTAPEDGWLVNSHIIELPTQVFIVDAQYTLDYAQEVFTFAKSLGKPVTRLYITHYHPDHLMGAAAFTGVPIYALPEVKAKIEAVGDRVAKEEHEKMGDRINA